MSTLIQSINKISEIKSDLNDILRANGLEGGDVFTDYPDKFRELFRVMTVLTDSTATGYEPESVNVITEVPDPTLSQYQNVVYVTNNLDEATIYYYVHTDSGNNEIGVTALEKGKSIIVSEPSTVYVYAQYRAEKSSTVSIYVPWSAEIVPDPPVIYRNGTTVTITCNEGDEIYYNIGDEFVLYTGPITVSQTLDVYAFAQNYRGRSDTVVDEAPARPEKPATPVITCSQNTVTITCDTTGAVIWYKRTTDNLWTKYTGPFTIDRSGFYIAKSVKELTYSDESDAVWCEYVTAPEKPTFNVTDNKVYIMCSTAGATIYYKIGSGSYQLYTGPITLTETVTITAYSTKNGMDSDTVTKTCTYVEPVTPTVPADPTFSCSNNIVTISCATSGASIYYRTVDGGQWQLYTGPIEINADTTFWAYSTKTGLSSNIVTYTATYIEPVTPEIPNAPVFNCTNNRVTITCSTINASIYYRKIDDSQYIRYTGPITITEDTTFVAYSYKNGQSSNTVTYNAVYVPDTVIPADPVIKCINNVVSITCSTSDATIYYKINDGEWFAYNGQFSIDSTITVYAIAILGDIWSNTVSEVCVYHVIISYNYLTLHIITAGQIWIQSRLDSSYGTDGDTKPLLYYYSKDGSNWILKRNRVKYSSTGVINVNPGDTVLLKTYYFEDGSTYAIKGKKNPYQICSSGTKFTVSGNPISLIDYNSAYSDLEYRFDYMFYNCTGLTDASALELPFTALCGQSYASMFEGCTNLMYGPYLPSTLLSYQCYAGMFYNCSNLINAPRLEAPALVSGCYKIMFTNCTKLKYIKCTATDLGENNSFNWLLGASATGTFVKATGVTWPSGSSGIPAGWSVVEDS